LAPGNLNGRAKNKLPFAGEILKSSPRIVTVSSVYQTCHRTNINPTNHEPATCKATATKQASSGTSGRCTPQLRTQAGPASVWIPDRHDHACAQIHEPHRVRTLVAINPNP